MDWLSYKGWLGDSLKSELPYEMSCPNLDQWATDTRELKKGDWFIPLKGENFDGHSFIQEALNKGAIGYLVNESSKLRYDTPHIIVSDTMKAYHLLASGWRSTLTSPFQLIALTGSVGKTTVKTLIIRMLSHFAKTFSTPGNQNTEFSIPKALSFNS
jgi:UDP-N-acetylmuramoyl-tripeptide--D-alanyl-D-alanine ligase